MELIKHIAAILGLILTAASVITLVSKTARSAISNAIRKYGRTNESEATIAEIKTLLERHIKDDECFKADMKAQSEINQEFTKAQCRNIIKNIFYRYEGTKTLPLYEKKALLLIEDLYVERLKGNSFAGLLLDEMRDWDVDYSKGHQESEA